jgi:hypothetical protein
VIKRTFFSIILLIVSISAFPATHIIKNKTAYYFHISVHDNGIVGSHNGYPRHTYNVYAFITSSSTADLSHALPVNDPLTCNATFLVLSDGSKGSKTVTKQYIINTGSSYCVGATNAGSNLKITVNSIALSTYLYNGNTIHIDYTVHYF